MLWGRSNSKGPGPPIVSRVKCPSASSDRSSTQTLGLVTTFVDVHCARLPVTQNHYHSRDGRYIVGQTVATQQPVEKDRHREQTGF